MSATEGKADGEFFGSMRMADGSRHVLTADEAKALWEASEAATAKLAADMPAEADALREMSRAFDRLKQLGWREAVNCPKDGSRFDVIEMGSTGIHRCHYEGEWPTGTWWIHDAGDLWPSRPVLFRLDPEAEAACKQKMADAIAAYAAQEAAEKQHHWATRFGLVVCEKCGLVKNESSDSRECKGPARIGPRAALSSPEREGGA